MRKKEDDFAGQMDFSDLDQSKLYDYMCDSCRFNKRAPVLNSKINYLPEDHSCRKDTNRLTPVKLCTDYLPNADCFRCCHTCKCGNVFVKGNCDFDSNEVGTPNRHHRDGFPNNNSYWDGRQFDVCDWYVPDDMYEDRKLL